MLSADRKITWGEPHRRYRPNPLIIAAFPEGPTKGHRLTRLYGEAHVIEDPERWLFWSVDEAAALMGSALLGLAAKQFVPGLIAGLSGWLHRRARARRRTPNRPYRRRRRGGGLVRRVRVVVAENAVAVPSKLG